MSSVVSVNISNKKGTVKFPVKEIIITENGIEGDAHAGTWNRQVSLLGIESIERFGDQVDRKMKSGEFAENITTRNIKLYETLPLDRLIIGECELEITQIGKKCHGRSCQIFKTTGDCVMPKEGIFSRILKKGIIKPGMTIEFFPRIFNILIVTLSDRASMGTYIDKSGPLLEKQVSRYFNSKGRKYKVQSIIAPDKSELLNAILQDYQLYDIIFTTGSTGLGPNDIAPDVIKPFLDKEIPGIMEMVRMKYGAEKPRALLSRSIAGIKGETLIYVIPGNPKAVEEYCDEIFKSLEHCIYMIHGLDIH